MTSNEFCAPGSFGTGSAMTATSNRTTDGALARGTGFVSDLWSSITRASKIRQTRRMLAGLDDRILKDIGISYSEIDAVAIHCVDHPDMPYHRRA